MSDQRVRRMTCPECLAALEWRQVKITAVFSCPRCRTALMVSPVYKTVVVALGVGIAAALAYKGEMSGLDIQFDAFPTNVERPLRARRVIGSGFRPTPANVLRSVAFSGTPPPTRRVANGCY